MSWTNTPERYGIVSKSLHWLLFLAVVAQYSFVYRRHQLPEGTPEHLQYILWHKSLGGFLLMVMPFVIAWRFWNTYPRLRGVPSWQAKLARTNQWVMTFMLLGMPLGGYLMSCAGGYPVVVLGYPLPMLIGKDKALSAMFYQGHVWGSYLLLALVGIHVAAGVFHTFWHKHRFIHRMLPDFVTRTRH